MSVIYKDIDLVRKASKVQLQTHHSLVFGETGGLFTYALADLIYFPFLLGLRVFSKLL